MATREEKLAGPGFSFEDFDWHSWMRVRPCKPPSFFQRLYGHHSAARVGNNFDKAHDAGAGAAVLSQELAHKFKHVIVSDINTKCLTIAEQRLAALPEPFPEGTFSFLTEEAEKSSVPDGSIDCYTICVALHWTDAQATLAESARQLKSGGTFCMSCRY
jgi:ubiquinone/menaquinone biosynthesis C-methylase UbiE